MPLRVRIHEHARIKNALGIQQLLDGFHDGIGGCAPFHFHKGGYVTACAVFRLERTVVLFSDELAEVVHKGRVAGHFCGRAEVLPEDEVQVAVSGMSEQGGHCVAVTGKQGLQVSGGFTKTFKRKGHVFDNNGCAHRTHAAHRSQNALTDQPQLAVFFSLVGKGMGTNKLHVLEGVIDGGDVFVQLFLG